MKVKMAVLSLVIAILLAGCGHVTVRTESTPSSTPIFTPMPTPDAAVLPTIEARLEPAPTPAPAATPTPTADPTPTPTPTIPPELSDDTLVNVQDYLPGVFVDLRYATTNNFTGQVIYDFTDAKLRYGTVKKLGVAAETLAQQGYALLIWDACRPVSAQFRLWEVCPNSTYVANPNTGYSKHSRGNTVDITLVTLSGGEVEMPSNFDEFSALADRDYSDVSEAAAQHASLLEQAMTDAGFVPYAGEWWHYSDSIQYEVVQ